MSSTPSSKKPTKKVPKQSTQQQPQAEGSLSSEAQAAITSLDQKLSRAEALLSRAERISNSIPQNQTQFQDYSTSRTPEALKHYEEASTSILPQSTLPNHMITQQKLYENLFQANDNLQKLFDTLSGGNSHMDAPAREIPSGFIPAMNALDVAIGDEMGRYHNLIEQLNELLIH